MTTESAFEKNLKINNELEGKNTSTPVWTPEKEESLLKLSQELENLKNEYARLKTIYDDMPDDEEKEKVTRVEEKINKKRKRKFLTVLGLTGALTTAAGLGWVTNSTNKDVDKSGGTANTKPEPGSESFKDTTKQITKTETKKNTLDFNQEVYNSLPDPAKPIYHRYYENSPTPDRGYQILDKKTATLFIFNKENKLIAKDTVGFGIDEGDAKNTSKEFKKGIRTTPSGVFMLSNFATQKDRDEYGDLQLSLTGISILGDTTFLGEHQTYRKHGQFKIRTKKLNTPNPKDNNFSDGCINIKPENFQSHVQPNFKGDYSELIFVLQDEKGEQSGKKFDSEKLIKDIMPMMINVALKQKDHYEKIIAETSKMINNDSSEINSLQKEHIRLVKEYQNDKNTTKEKKIETIKKKINKLKNKIGTNRDSLTKATQERNNAISKSEYAKRTLSNRG